MIGWLPPRHVTEVNLTCQRHYLDVAAAEELVEGEHAVRLVGAEREGDVELSLALVTGDLDVSAAVQEGEGHHVHRLSTYRGQTGQRSAGVNRGGTTRHPGGNQNGKLRRRSISSKH